MHFERSENGILFHVRESNTIEEAMVGYATLKKEYQVKVKELLPTVKASILREQLEALALTGKVWALSLADDEAKQFDSISGNHSELNRVVMFQVVPWLWEHFGQDIFKGQNLPGNKDNDFCYTSEAYADATILKPADKRAKQKLAELAEELEPEAQEEWRQWFANFKGYDPVSILAHIRDLLDRGSCRFSEVIDAFLKAHRIRLKSGLIKGFKTKLKEALALAKRKAASAVSLAELRLMQSLPLDIKVRKTLLRIREWYEHYGGRVCSNFSGGKDSTVLLHLVRSLYPEVPAVFIDTGLEDPRVRAFALRQPSVVVLHPKMPFHKVVDKHGFVVGGKDIASTVYKLRNCNLSDAYRNKLLHGDEKGKAGMLPAKWRTLLDAPFKVSDNCCKIMKHEPLFRYQKETGNMPFVGTLAEESRRRTLNYLDGGCNNYLRSHPISTPLGFWTEQDILRYIKENNLEIAEAYGDIVEKDGVLSTMKEQRTGCQFCLVGIEREQTPNRFQRLALEFPKRYKFCMEKLGMDIALNYLNVDFVPVA